MNMPVVCAWLALICEWLIMVLPRALGAMAVLALGVMVWEMLTN